MPIPGTDPGLFANEAVFLKARTEVAHLTPKVNPKRDSLLVKGREARTEGNVSQFCRELRVRSWGLCWGLTSEVSLISEERQLGEVANYGDWRTCRSLK